MPSIVAIVVARKHMFAQLWQMDSNYSSVVTTPRNIKMVLPIAEAAARIDDETSRLIEESAAQ
ncbi:MAG: hypothetical protein RLZZ92_793 [Actinomycetota bacterium]